MIFHWWFGSFYGRTMPKLQVWSLFMNQLSGFVPTTLFCNEDNNNNNNASNFRIVQLGFNRITVISNPQIGKCVDYFLEILDLKENHISSF